MFHTQTMKIVSEQSYFLIRISYFNIFKGQTRLKRKRNKDDWLL